jgi:hypothetical protein
MTGDERAAKLEREVAELREALAECQAHNDQDCVAAMAHNQVAEQLAETERERQNLADSLKSMMDARLAERLVIEAVGAWRAEYPEDLTGGSWVTDRSRELIAAFDSLMELRPEGRASTAVPD